MKIISNFIYLRVNLIFYMKKLTMIIIAIFMAIIISSVQSISAEENIPIKGLFVNPGEVELVTTENTNYKIYLQVIIRNADGQLVNVTESTANGAYIPHMISDHIFDTVMSEKEIITVNDTEYEKAQWRFNPSLEHRFIGLYPIYSEVTLEFVSEPGQDTTKMYEAKKDFSIWKIHYCADWENFGYSCIPVFQVLVPNMTVEPTDIVELQWTILKEIDHSFDESTETSKWHMLDP